MSTLWAFRALYTVRHEFFNAQLCSIAAFRVLFDLESSPFQLQTFIRACQALYELGERFPIAGDVLASLQSVVKQRSLHLPLFAEKHLSVEVSAVGSIMQHTAVLAALRTDSSIQKEPDRLRLTISDLVARADTDIEPD